MKKITLFIMIMLLFSSFLIIPTEGEQGWQITRNKVYIDDSRVYLSATPYSLKSSGWVEFELKSKVYTGNIDLVWGFNTATITPKSPQIWKYYTHFTEEYVFVDADKTLTLNDVTAYTNLGIENYTNYEVILGNEHNSKLYNVTFDKGTWVVAFNSISINGDDYTITYTYSKQEKIIHSSDYYDWKDLELTPEIKNHQFKDMDKWYLFKNVPISSGVTYKIRVWMDIPFSPIPQNGKYWWALKPSSLTLEQSIAQDKLYYLDPWWDVAWSHYVPITIKNSYIATPLENFTVLVKINATISALCDSGDSIRFVAEDNTTVFYHEIEYQATTDSPYKAWSTENVVWVKIPVIPSGSDYTFLMYYNNSGATCTSDPSNTWSNGYDLVLHMNNNEFFAGAGVTAVGRDSAGLSPGGFENSTTPGDLIYGNASTVPGMIGNATFMWANGFWPFGDVLDLGYGAYTPSGVYGLCPNWTLTFWSLQPATTGATRGVYAKYNDGVGKGLRYYMWEGDNRDIYTYLKGAALVNLVKDLSPNQELNWNYYSYNFSYNNRELICINRSTYISSATTAMDNLSCYGQTGATYDGTVIGRDNYGTKYFYGALDEFRLTIGEERNSSWHDAEYNTTAASDFLSIGAEQTYTPPKAWTTVDIWDISLYNVSAWHSNNLYEWFNPTSNTAASANYTNWKSYSFKIGSTGENTNFVLSNVGMRLFRGVGGTPGICFIRLYASDVNHAPTGPILSQGSFDGNKLPLSASAVWMNISMPAYNMVAGTRYNLVFLSSTSSLFYFSSCSNATVPGSATYLWGFARGSVDIGLTWGNVYENTDYLFEVWGSSTAAESKVWDVTLFNDTNFRIVQNWSAQLHGISSWRNDSNVWNIALYNWTWQWLNVTIQGFGSVALVPTGGLYHIGDVVNLTATAFIMCDFDHWGGDLAGNANPTTILIDSDKNVIANFSGSIFTWTDNDTDIPSLPDVIDPNTGMFNWARIFTIAWYYVFGGWFVALILGIIGGGLYVKYKSPEIAVAYFVVILILYAAVTQSIAYTVSVLIALVIGYLFYRLIPKR